MLNDIKQLKDQTNNLYLSVINKMESRADVSEVRTAFIDIATLLNDLSKVSVVDRKKASEKARQFIAYAKEAREKASYEDIYYRLKGKRLAPLKEKEKELTPAPNKPEVKKEKYEEERGIGYTFNWNTVTNVNFDDVAGLERVKDEVKKNVILPLTKPHLYEGYDYALGGGLLLYGPPGTGKTMIGAAIANELKAKFCCIKTSDLLTTGVGNTEKLIKTLFEEARSFKTAIIYFEEIDALCPKNTKSSVTRQIRSELLTQMQGLESFKDNKDGKILYLVASTNKPWDIDPAFLRPGRFDVRVYVDLPDREARKYMIESSINKMKKMSLVDIGDIDIDAIADLTNDYSGADIKLLIKEAQSISIERLQLTGERTLLQSDFIDALEIVTSSVQNEDIQKLAEWDRINNRKKG